MRKKKKKKKKEKKKKKKKNNGREVFESVQTQLKIEKILEGKR